jgi:hypothetical protein
VTHLDTPDPPYTSLAAQCQGHWTAGDLMYGGFLDWGPALVQERVPWTDPPAYMARIEKHREYLRLCYACDRVDRSPEAQLELFNELRAIGL